MSDKKVISINPDLFSLSLNNKTRKRTPKEGKSIKIKSNKPMNKSTQSKILKEIRKKQEESYKKLFQDTLDKNKPFTNTVRNEEKTDFENSIEYMKTKLEEQKNKEQENKPKNTTIKNYNQPDNIHFNSFLSNQSAPVSVQNFSNIPNELPNIYPNNPDDIFRIKPPIIHSQPKFGCLKNGQLPTFRQFNRNGTQKNYSSLHYVNPISNPSPIINTAINPSPIINTAINPSPIINTAINPSPIINTAINPSPIINTAIDPIPKEETINSVLTERIKQITENNQYNKLLEQSKNHVPKNLKYLKQKKTIKRTFHIGKSPKYNKIGVLVSNRTIRKERTTKALLLKQENINNVKRFLIKKGFITVGTTAPNDVLRQMYESIHLIGGDIYNHNPENLLYNYLHE